MNRRVITVLIALLSFAPSTARAQQNPGRILGVFDNVTGEPIVGAEVIAVLSGDKVITSATGTVTLNFLPDSLNLVQIRKIGYESRTLTLASSLLDTTSVTVVLNPAGQRLGTVTTTAKGPGEGRLTGFESRRAAGFGSFVTREELAKDEKGRRTIEFIARLPGVQIVLDKKKGLEYVGSSRGQGSVTSGPCMSAVIVDGITVFSGQSGQDPFDPNSIEPDQIAGMEFYRGGATMPSEFNQTRGTCGLLIIWTRTR